MGRRKGQDINGVLLLDKPVDLSSNHALQRSRRLFDARKGGHTGTLDPFATGLLVCCFGLATKICGEMLNADKVYRATLSLGSETDSGDHTGTVTESAQDFQGVSLAMVEKVLPQFTGEIQQIPPMYSALKRDGKPLYKYAREGIELEREPRTVKIYSLDIIQMSEHEIVLDVACSKGTYIRTLAQDIGRALNCFAHLTALRRLSVGSFSLNDGYTLEQLQELSDPTKILIPLEQLPADVVPEKLLNRINNYESSAS